MMEKKRNLPRGSRKTFDKLSIRQKRLHHQIILKATINALNTPQTKPSNNRAIQENERSEHIPCCNERTLIVNNDNNNISLISSTNSSDYYSNTSDSDSKSDSDSESDSDIISNNINKKKFTDFGARLAQACSESHMTHVQINSVLKVLREHECLKNLPKDARTLLGTPKDCNKKIRDVFPGQYLHVGICENILKKLLLCDELPLEILIDISTDGANVYESVTFDIWPIQFRIINIKDKSPMIAGVYAGTKKPADFIDFFKDFNLELLQLLKKGISFNNKIIKIKLNCFIADTPARHACLNIKGHAGFNSCNKCKIPGERHKTDRTTIFKGTNHPSRTDEEYRQEEKMDVNHHHGYSALHLLPLDLVRQTPLDYMHLVCLGVVKQIIIKAWLEGFYRPAKLKDVVKDRISNRLSTLITYCPCEFSRKPRSLDYCRRFKATEFRQLLLFTGPTVLLDLFGDDERIQHFLKLHYAIRILVSSNEKTHNDIEKAKMILESFVTDSIAVYGRNFLSYNVHNLIHLTDDVHNFGPLDHFSCFPFENNMMFFKKVVRKPLLPLQQIYNRYIETKNHNFKSFSQNFAITTRVYRPKLRNGPLVQQGNIKQFSCIKINKITYKLDKSNHCCILQDGTVCIIMNILQYDDSNEYRLIVNKFQVINAFYNINNLDSREVGIFKCTELSRDLHEISFRDIKSKAYKMPYWQNAELDFEKNIYIVVEIYNDEWLLH